MYNRGNEESGFDSKLLFKHETDIPFDIQDTELNADECRLRLHSGFKRFKSGFKSLEMFDQKMRVQNEKGGFDNC